MFLNRWKWAVVWALSLSGYACGSDPTDQQAYCTYLTEQAAAQRDLLRTPAALAGLTQPETGLPTQVVAGASLGLSDFKKAGLTMSAARKNCELYKATTAAQQSVQYAVSRLEKEALRNRLTLIEQASKSLDALMEKTAHMVEAQNATRVMLFALQTTKIKLEADHADTQSKITALYAPALSAKPLKELVEEKQNGEVDQQKIIDKLNRQNNWDVALSVGVHQQINPIAQNIQPYGAVSINYNLASRIINRHLDRAAESYAEWKKVQEGDVMRNVEVLRQQLEDSMAAQQARLKSLQEQSGQIDKTLQLVANPDTSAAFDFHNQLTAARLLLDIESADASFRLEQLKEYLARNY
jgi:hypothetical protein